MGEEVSADNAAGGMSRGQLREQVITTDGVTEAVAAFADYFSVPVAIQLKHELVLCGFSGRWIPVPGQNTRLGIPIAMKDGAEEDGPVMSTDLLEPGLLGGPVFIEPSNTGQRLCLLLPSQEATVRITVDPEDVRYVTRIDPSMAAEPSPIISS